ncbi:MAG: hypothetical protein DBP03_04795 [gamma proteobacterium symbiont of Ctena orbiculata]|nr:MAG: hypothetical protein DBP03_04795 [gamma proteobacterium symbiont of Ctena orbiculata]PUB79394.1 MAG: hypothetical protein DBO99_04585 [gamma proteobacterium symbiont of Ctena orbiculata]
MKSLVKNSLKATALVGAFGMLWSGMASAVDVYLAAGRFLQTINGEAIPMWGYMSYDPGSAPTACSQVNNNAALQAPGPEIVTNAGDDVVVHLLNCIPGADNRVADNRTSVMIPGQPMPAVVDPNPGNNAADGPRYYGGGNPNFAGRMRSQVKETRRLSSGRPQAVTYTFSNVREGTFIYHSATHMQVQVQMGLHGPLTVCPSTSPYNATQGRCAGGGNRPYTGARTGYFREASLFYSEIDPAIHLAVDRGCYGPDADAGACSPANQGLRTTSTIKYAPKYILINGEPFDGSKLDLQTDIGLPNANRKILLRVRSAGNRYHSIACKFCADEPRGFGARAIAEDGYLYRFALDGADLKDDTGTVYEKMQEVFLVSPLQTRDIYVNNVDPDDGGPLGYQLMLELDRFGEIPPVTGVTPAVAVGP